MSKKINKKTKIRKNPADLIWYETNRRGGFQTTLNKKCTIYFGPADDPNKYEWRVGTGVDISPSSIPRNVWDPVKGELHRIGTVGGKTKSIARGVAKSMAVREGRKICRLLYPELKSK